MAIRLEHGPFRHFEGEWHLRPLAADACRIEFGLRYDFRRSATAKLAGPVLDRVANTLVDAFVARARLRLRGKVHRRKPARRRRRAQEEPTIMITPERLQALRQSKLAEELSDEQCSVLAEKVTLRELKDGEVLVRAGQSDNQLYVIVKGVLKVVKNAASHDEVTFFSIGTGDFVDELSFMDGTEHYASLVALGDTRVLGLEREKLESMLTSRPDIVYKVMRSIVRAVHQIQRRLSMQSVELTNYIYKQHGRY